MGFVGNNSVLKSIEVCTLPPKGSNHLLYNLKVNLRRHLLAGTPRIQPAARFSNFDFILAVEEVFHVIYSKDDIILTFKPH